MVTQSKTFFVCKECGHTQKSWSGKCGSCTLWNTLEEKDIPTDVVSAKAGISVRAMKAKTGNTPQKVSTIAAATKKTPRLTTNISEFDRVLGGGLVPGGVILLAGAPGIGKSSCALAVAASVASQGKKVLYVTGEETAEQVAARAQRIGATEGGEVVDNLFLLAESNTQSVIEHIHDLSPNFFIIDSIQTLVSGESESRGGSITQVSEVASEFNGLAKRMGIPAILIGHVTKDGQIAGPRVVEHLVDVVLFFETAEGSPLKLLRANKNRYGATDEIGCFEHTSEGLIPVTDPSGFFTSPHVEGVTGFATTITLEGIRALPIEMQSLVVRTNLPNPRRVTQGIEHGRSLQIQAVLDRYVSSQLGIYDVYVSTTGGIKIKDPATDLAIAAAIISSTYDIPLPVDTIFIGEASLTGEIREPKERNKRIVEAARLGFKKVFTTKGSTNDLKPSTHQMVIVEVATIRELCEHISKMKNRI